MKALLYHKRFLNGLKNSKMVERLYRLTRLKRLVTQTFMDYVGTVSQRSERLNMRTNYSMTVKNGMVTVMEQKRKTYCILKSHLIPHVNASSNYVLKKIIFSKNIVFKTLP